MKQTKKYTGACKKLKFPHKTQDELYAELNRRGFYWQPKKQEWEKNSTPAKLATKLIKIRVMAAASLVQQAAELLTEQVECVGMKFVDRSKLYHCKPPNQNQMRIYLTFENVEE